MSVSSAKADEISFQDTIAVTSTTWFDTLSVPKFNPALGTLQTIDFTLEGTVMGEAKYESLDADPATVSLNLQAQITVQRPDLSNLIVVLPVVNVVENATAFDGAIDFDGGSGSTFSNLLAMDSTSASSPPPASDLVLFTGIGNIDLPVNALGTSSGSGAGNLILQFMTDAGATLTVKYTYMVPEPGSLMMLASGAVMCLARRRMRHI
jgi:hypothetical protein